VSLATDLENMSSVIKHAEPGQISLDYAQALLTQAAERLAVLEAITAQPNALSVQWLTDSSAQVNLNAVITDSAAAELLRIIAGD